MEEMTLEQAQNNPEIMQRMAEAFREYADRFIKALQPLIEAFRKLAAACWKWMCERYEANGSAYGPEDEGMLRWWHNDAIPALRRIIGTGQPQGVGG